MKFNALIIGALFNNKKVRRKCWGKYCYIVYKYDYHNKKAEFLNQNGNYFSLSANALIADDWEVVDD